MAENSTITTEQLLALNDKGTVSTEELLGSVKPPKSDPTLPQYIKYKLDVDRASSERSKFGRDAMWGRIDNDSALKKGNEARDYWMKQAGPYDDIPFTQDPIKNIAGATASLIPYMVSSQKEGLKQGLILGGGFAAIAGIVGQAGPQALMPEEFLTVPASFGAGMSVGWGYGVLTHTLDREGGSTYLDMIEQGISPETARPLALAGGTIIGLIEMAQFKLLAKPFKQAFGKVLKTPVGKKAITQAVGRYIKTNLGEIAQEELQEVTSLVVETMAGMIDEKPDAVPTKKEWIERLVETAKAMASGMPLISMPGAILDVTSSIKNARLANKKVDMEKLSVMLEKVKEQEKSKVDIKEPTAMGGPQVLEGEFAPFTKPPLPKANETKEDFVKRVKSTELTTEDKELKPGETGFMDKVAMMDSKTGEVFAYKIGEQDIFNHSDIFIKHKMDDATVVPGFIDKQGNFVYQYPDDAYDKLKPTPSKGGEIETAKLPSVTKIGKTVQDIISKSRTEKPGYLNKKLQEEYEKISSREEQREFLKQSIDTLEQEVNFFKENKISTTKLAEYKDKIKDLPSSFKSSKSTAMGADELREIASGQIGRFETIDEVLDYAKDVADRLKSLKAEYKSLSPEMITKKDITIVKQRMKDLEAGFKKGVSITKSQIKEFQSDLIRLINSADLLPKDRVKFLSTIKNIQTEKQFIKFLPQIEERIRTLSEKQEKIDLAKEITNIAQKKIDPDYQEQIDEILENYDLKARTEATKKRRLSRQEFFEREVATGNLDFIPQEFFREFGKKTLDEMTLEEVEQLYDQISVLSTIGATKSKLLAIRGEKDLAIRLNNIVDTIYNTAGKIETPVEGAEVPLVPNAKKTALQRTLNMVSDYFAAHRKVEFITKDLGVNNDIFETIQVGINKELATAEAAYNKLREAFKLIESDLNNMSTKPVKIEGVPVEMTREQMIGIALNSGNEGNLNRLINGNKFTMEQINAIKENLTPQENEFVGKVFETVNSLFPDTVGVSKKLLGIKPKKVEGDYFPIVTDRELNKLAQLREAESDLFQDVFQTTFVERYFTKARIGGRAPVDLNVFKVIFGHIDAVTHFNSLAIPIRDIQKIISNPRFKKSIIGAMDESTYEQFQPWLRSIANPKNLIPSGPMDKVAAMLRHNATTAILGWRFSVSLLQAGSFTQTINEIGIKDAANGIGQYWAAPGEAKDFIYSKSEIMRNRKMQFDREIKDWLKSENARHITRGDKSWEEILFELIRGVDFITTAPSWLGAYHKQYNLTNNADEAAIYADGVVRRTQPAGAMENLAQVMKGTAMQKLFTSFMTHFANMHNQLVSALNEYKYSKSHPLFKSANLARSMWWLWLAPALLAGWVRSGFKTDDWRKYAQEVVAYPLTGLFLVRDLMNSIVKGFDIGAPPGLGGVQEVSYTVKGKELRTKIKHGVKAVGLLTGKIPTQAVDTAEAFIDLMTGKSRDWKRLIWTESSLKDVTKGLFSRKKKSVF